MTYKRMSLKIVDWPAKGRTVCAPPIHEPSAHTVDYCCGRCGAVLLQAEERQIRNLIFQCTLCETYNSTDS
jgi:hypothetical protein